LNGIGLLVGGFMITFFALQMLGGDGGFTEGVSKLTELKGRFNSIGGPKSSVPVSTIFSGIMLLNMFYWCTNQQIIQRTFGASSLAEGQKGVLLTGTLKLFGPMYLVLPGIIAYALFAKQGIKADHAYGTLVNRVLPAPLTGFFAAVMMGAILSSFNSALNSTCTLFSLGLYKNVLKKDATEEQVVKSGKWFGLFMALAAMTVAPLLADVGSIFGYLQKMNGIYFIPIFAVVIVGMLTRRVPPVAAKIGLIAGFAIIITGYFIPPFNMIVEQMNDFHFLGTVFCYLVILMLIIGEIKPRETEFVQEDAKAVDMTPWKKAKLVGALLVAIVLLIYILFADFSVLAV
jgi:SSS family solute:Na+ symporter